MSEKNKRIIPTLDDVIKPGVINETQNAEPSPGKSRPSTHPSAQTDEDFFTEDFAKIFASAENNRHQLPDQIINDSGHSKTDGKNKSQNQLVDRGVAQRTKPDDATLQVAEKDAAPKSSTVQKPAAAPAKTRPPAQAEAASVKTPSANPTSTKINIDAVVDEITSQLMPEIEWKIRTRVRDILEQHFPAKD